MIESYLYGMAPIIKNIIEKNGKKNDEIKILHIAICFVIILFGIM